MIKLTRLKGEELAVNADLIERAESTPDTVVTLVDGTKYVVAETVQEVVDKVRDFRASVLVAAGRMQSHDEAKGAAEENPEPALRLISPEPG